MIHLGRRRFFTSVFSAGAAVAAASAGGGPVEAAAAEATPGITGLCLYVPGLGQAGEFVAAMTRNAPGRWTAHPLPGAITERYFAARSLYERARGNANTFVGVVDPATFAVVHEAIVDAGGSFHYVTEARDRVTFSVQL
jgi:hypothetical protein